MAIASLAALAGTLLVPAMDAAAQVLAPPTVASNLCNYASNKPALLRANLQAILVADGFIGLPPDQCPKFAKGLVKSCLTLVKDITRCSTDANAMNGKIETLNCDAQPTKDDVKSCKQTVKTNLRNAQANASQPIKLQGDLVCNGSFANHFEDVCITGTVPPP
jgi:hypothetical protein